MNEKRIVTLDRDGRVIQTVVHQEPGNLAMLLIHNAAKIFLVGIAVGVPFGYILHVLVSTRRI